MEKRGIRNLQQCLSVLWLLCFPCNLFLIFNKNFGYRSRKKRKGSKILLQQAILLLKHFHGSLLLSLLSGSTMQGGFCSFSCQFLYSRFTNLTGSTTCYAFINGFLQELNWFKQLYGSWFLGDSVCEGEWLCHLEHCLQFVNLKFQCQVFLSVTVAFLLVVIQMVACMLQLQSTLFFFFCLFLRQLE